MGKGDVSYEKVMREQNKLDAEDLEQMSLKVQRQDEESLAYTMSDLSLGLINYNFKCVAGAYLDKSIHLI